MYTGTSRSITVLEVLAHADPDLLPADLTMFRIEIPDALSFDRVDGASLPDDWRTPGHPDCIARGDEWVRQGSRPLLFVPSAIVPEEWNLLINSRHADAAQITVVFASRFTFDPRLL